MRLRPGIEGLRLVAPHVGFEPAQPEQAGLRAGPLPHRNPPRRRAGSNFEEFQAIMAHGSSPANQRCATIGHAVVSNNHPTRMSDLAPGLQATSPLRFRACRPVKHERR
jgi:hypothetical protein